MRPSRALARSPMPGSSPSRASPQLWWIPCESYGAAQGIRAQGGGSRGIGKEMDDVTCRICTGLKLLAANDEICKDMVVDMNLLDLLFVILEAGLVALADTPARPQLMASAMALLRQMMASDHVKQSIDVPEFISIASSNLRMYVDEAYPAASDPGNKVLEHTLGTISAPVLAEPRRIGGPCRWRLRSAGRQRHANHSRSHHSRWERREPWSSRHNSSARDRQSSPPGMQWRCGTSRRAAPHVRELLAQLLGGRSHRERQGCGSGCVRRRRRRRDPGRDELRLTFLHWIKHFLSYVSLI